MKRIRVGKKYCITWCRRRGKIPCSLRSVKYYISVFFFFLHVPVRVVCHVQVKITCSRTVY